MNLTATDYVSWIAGTFLRVLLCFLLLRYRVHRQMPIFSTGIFLASARTFLLWWLYHDPSIEMGLVFNTYWMSQLLLVSVRGAIVVELCWLTLRTYRGLWALASRLLIGVGVVVASFACMAALQKPFYTQPIFLRAERGLEVAVLGLLVTLFALCRYYGIPTEVTVRYIAFGLGLHAMIQTANNTFFFARTGSFETWWSVIRTTSFDISLLIWCWALRKPVTRPLMAPAMLEPGVYGELTPQVSQRLRMLNDRLMDMLK